MYENMVTLLWKMSRKLVFRQPGHRSSMPSEFPYHPLYSLFTFSIHTSLLVSIYSRFLVISLESINQEAILGLQSSKCSCFWKNCRIQVTKTTLLMFSFKENDWLDCQSGRRKKVTAFLSTINLPHFHGRSALAQRIQASQIRNGTLAKKIKQELCPPFSLFQVPAMKVLLS